MMVRLDVAEGCNNRQVEQRNENKLISRDSNRNCHASQSQEEEKEEYSNLQDYLQVSSNSEIIEEMHETMINSTTTSDCVPAQTSQATAMTRTSSDQDHEHHQLSQMFPSPDDGQFDFSFDDQDEFNSSVKGSLASTTTTPATGDKMYHLVVGNTMQMSSSNSGDDCSQQFSSQQLDSHSHLQNIHEKGQDSSLVADSFSGMANDCEHFEMHNNNQETATTNYVDDEEEAFIATCFEESTVLNNDPSRKYYTNKLYQPLNPNHHNNHEQQQQQHHHHHQQQQQQLNLNSNHHQHHHLTQQNLLPNSGNSNDGMLLDQIVDDELLLYQELQNLKRSKKINQESLSVSMGVERKQPELNRILQDDDDGDAEDDDDAQDSLDQLQLTKIIEDFDSFSPSPLFSTHHNGDLLSSSSLETMKHQDTNSTTNTKTTNPHAEEQGHSHLPTGGEIKRPHKDDDMMNDSITRDGSLSIEADDDGMSSAQDDASTTITISGGSRRSRSSSSSNPGNKYRRCTANARERIRMREINKAFEKLKKAVPVELIQQLVSNEESDQMNNHGGSRRGGGGGSSSSSSGSHKSSSSTSATHQPRGQDGQPVKLTKITTLKLAAFYISRLRELATQTADGTCDASQLQVPVIRSKEHTGCSMDGRSKDGPSKRARRRKSRSTEVKRNPGSSSKTKIQKGRSKLASGPSALKKMINKNSFGSNDGKQLVSPVVMQQQQPGNGGQQQLAVQRIVMNNQSDLHQKHHHHYQPQQQQQQHPPLQPQQVILTNGIINQGLKYQPSQQNGSATAFIPIQQQQVNPTNSSHINHQQPQQFQIISHQLQQNGHDKAFVTPVTLAIVGIPAGGFSRGPNEAQPIQILGITNPNQLAQRQQQQQPIRQHFQQARNNITNNGFNLIPQPAQPQQVTLTLNDINGLSVLRLASNSSATNINGINQYDNGGNQFTQQQQLPQQQIQTTVGPTTNGRFNYAIQPIQMASVQNQAMITQTGSGQPSNNLILSNNNNNNLSQNNLQYSHQPTGSTNMINLNNHSNGIITIQTSNSSTTQDNPLTAGSLRQSTTTTTNNSNSINDNNQQMCFQNTNTITATATPTTLTGNTSDCLQYRSQSQSLNISEEGIRELVANIATNIPSIDDRCSNSSYSSEAKGNTGHDAGGCGAKRDNKRQAKGVACAPDAGDNKHQVAGNNQDNNLKPNATKSVNSQQQQQPAKRTYRFHNYDGNMITNHLYSNHNHHDKSSSRISHAKRQEQNLTSANASATNGSKSGNSASNNQQQQQQQPSQRSRQNSLSSTCSTTSSLSSSLSPSNVTSPNLGPLLQTIMIRSPSLDCSSSSSGGSHGST